MPVTQSLFIVSLFGILSGIFSCSDRKSAFKPGVLTSRGYYVHAGKAYFYGGFSNASLVELTEADATEFKVFGQRFPGNECAAEYAGDNKVVYFAGRLINGADSKTFEVLDYGLGKDVNSVFYRHSVLSDDPANFVKIEGGFYRDSRHVYRGGYIVSDDPVNLKYLGQHGYIEYFSDSKGIIANDIRIDSVDVNSFVPLAHGYSKDKSHVFVIREARLEKVTNADAGSFQVVSKYFTKDSSNVFWRGTEMQEADPQTFKIISEEFHCSCDDRQVYFRNKKIPGADPGKIRAGKRLKYCNENEIVFED
ncbi:DKNYY domain-containing protein [Dyadobacter sp. CY343]|uniref:DKNYY domain-containing protein n=1 Tax=Dyadobacter sp. CY343 TaxID=2907299 RepID=UPI001F35057A|nr:DKNYY domain-containing protein [Dyadobacter sp. CY343]MCE7060365.1 DKNYY domain-containing protein [Dyadobacter sp. CY343]